VDQQTLNLFFGIAAIGAVVGLIIAMVLMHRQVTAVTSVLENVNSNPAVISAIRGATEGIPQVAFQQLLTTLSALRTFAPNSDSQALIDQLTQLLDRVDHDPTNDPAATLAQVKTIIAPSLRPNG
jgi:hypothetical protein